MESRSLDLIDNFNVGQRAVNRNANESQRSNGRRVNAKSAVDRLVLSKSSATYARRQRDARFDKQFTMRHTEDKQFMWCTSKFIGEGSTCKVFSGRRLTDGKEFAFKVYNESNSSIVQKMNRREWAVMKRLDHRNIVRMIGGKKEFSTGKDVIVMELCNGKSLAHMIDEPTDGYGLPEALCFQLLHDITMALAYLRKMEIVHRDVKPLNILVSYDRCGFPTFKLSDFGSCAELGVTESGDATSYMKNSDTTDIGSVHGTDEYLPPEMFATRHGRPHMTQSCSHATDASCHAFKSTGDLFSLGVTIFHAITGQLPFRSYGGRKNNSGLCEIFSRKPVGAIACTQTKDQYQEPSKLALVFDYKFGENVEFSRFGRELMEPLLGYLLSVPCCKHKPSNTFIGKYFPNLLNDTMQLTGEWESQFFFDLFFELEQKIHGYRPIPVYIPTLGRNEMIYLHQDGTACDRYFYDITHRLYPQQRPSCVDGLAAAVSRLHPTLVNPVLIAQASRRILISPTTVKQQAPLYLQREIDDDIVDEPELESAEWEPRSHSLLPTNPRVFYRRSSESSSDSGRGSINGAPISKKPEISNYSSGYGSGRGSGSGGGNSSGKSADSGFGRGSKSSEKSKNSSDFGSGSSQSSGNPVAGLAMGVF